MLQKIVFTFSGFQTRTIIFSRKEIFILLKNHLNEKSNVSYDVINNEINNKWDISYTLSQSDKNNISKILDKFRKKWQECRRFEPKFFEKFDKWLSVPVHFNEENDMIVRGNKNGRGRPSTSFQEASSRTKRRKAASLRDNHDVQELLCASEMSLRASGNRDAAKVVKDITTGSPSTASKYRSSLSKNEETELSADAALALLVEQKLTKGQYKGLRSVSLQQGCKLYPSYNSVLQAKQYCYPPKSDVKITESRAEIKLQSILNLTTQRLLLAQNEVIASFSSFDLQELELICKWGCDGTSGQSTFKQKFADDDGTKTDANIFFTSLVPLELFSIDKKNNSKIIVWKNPRTSSPRFCRPIKIEFLHETAEVARSEVERIKDEEKNLVPFETIVHGRKIFVNYKLALTMIDGKICNALTNTASTQRCYICNATSKDFNDIDKVLKNDINVENLDYGISSLHAWIRLFECCLHVSYKLETKKWQARVAEDKESVKLRKKNIQTGFRIQLGLIIDQPKQGFGSTNDGNTARRFFENAEISASITGFNLELIKRFHVILQVISCGHDINLEKFQQFSLETARKFVELYPWFPMPTTVHKILIHGPQIVASLLLPIGQLSEEAQESCNKYIKKSRQDYARKCSRLSNMEDVLNRLLIMSDPLICSFRKLPKKKLRCLSSEAIALLKEPFVPQTNSEETCNEEDYLSESENEDDDVFDDE